MFRHDDHPSKKDSSKSSSTNGGRKRDQPGNDGFVLVQPRRESKKPRRERKKGSQNQTRSQQPARKRSRKGQDKRAAKAGHSVIGKNDATCNALQSTTAVGKSDKPPTGKANQLPLVVDNKPSALTYFAIWTDGCVVVTTKANGNRISCKYNMPLYVSGDDTDHYYFIGSWQECQERIYSWAKSSTDPKTTSAAPPCSPTPWCTCVHR